VEQALLDFAPAAFADLGHMQIDHGRGQITVLEIHTYLPDGHPLLEQVGREAMPQGVARRIFLIRAAGTTTRSAAWILETLIGSVVAAMAACKVRERSFHPRATPGKSHCALR
jgi:hypothetical protein